MAVTRLLHVLGVVVWVGGMFFAYLALRPVVARQFEPPQKLKLWQGVLQRFFFWVWLAVALILSSGLYMMWQLGGMSAPPHVHAMMLIGIVMMLIFAQVYFAPFRRLQRSIAAQDWTSASAALNQIRIMVAINLTLGLINIAVAVLGQVTAV
ncbi:MAG TPA: CopD family protein [Burkholderiales bacterium]|nr:CopD family protein [Burkholderiales bacterium]